MRTLRRFRGAPRRPRPVAAFALLLGAVPMGRLPAQTPPASDCVATAPFRVLQPIASEPPHARAIWLDARTVRWPEAAAPSADSRYVLYASASASLLVRPGERVHGATDTVRLVARPTPLPAATAARTRHVRAGATLWPTPRAALTPAHFAQQLILVREDTAGRVLDATRTQQALALDARYADAVERTTLGVTPATTPGPNGAARVALWAPTAQRVHVCVYGAADAEPRVVPLRADRASGVWRASVPEMPRGAAYTYLVDVYVPGAGIVRNRVTDPWSLALTANSARSVVVDLDDPALAPPGWRARRAPSLRHATDQVIYELHVRDFSVHDASVPAAHRGRYLAFTDTGSHGMRHLRALAQAGLTDVHLLPVFDIATIPETGCRSPQPAGPPDGEAQQAAISAAAADDCYNWGYDPLHFTVPEGSYASDAQDHAVRIREFRRMVLALNAAGLRVGMDVVYNHTSAAGQGATSVLDRIVPGYYHRLNAEGAVETSTCCANTATEHRIMSKLMIESVVTWVRHYGISGFRFDLMGHQPRAAMVRLQRAVNAAAGRHVPLIGEGWNFGEVADGQRFVQASQLSLGGTGIATFSDRARDAIRGGSALDDGEAQVRNQGFVNGLGYAPNADRAALGTPESDRGALRQAADMVRVGLAGSLRTYRLVTATGDERPLAMLSYGNQPAGYTTAPTEVVNYVENHDNQTLYDVNVLRLPTNTPPAERARVQHLASALVLLSQGIAYVHAGQELLRSKSLDRNSFDSGDWFNHYDPTGRTHGFGRGLPPRSGNAASWPFMRPRLADSALVAREPEIRFTRDAFLDLLRIRASTPLFRLPTAAAVQRRLRFANTGPEQEPTVIVAHLDGRGLAQAGYRDVLYAVNVDQLPHVVRVPWLAGVPLRLHPVQAASTADARPRASTWSVREGGLLVPARTVVVWVRR